ncbi:RNA-directed DNA polymerase, eukaryota [Tanacetum coccineum]
MLTPNVDLLIRNLRLVWLGNFHMHANVARFNRDTKPSFSQKSTSYESLNVPKPSFANVVKDKGVQEKHDVPMMVLEDSTLNYEGNQTPHFEVLDRVVWIDVEGTPLCAWSQSTFNKIASNWGELVYLDDSNVSNKYNMHLCLKTRVHHLIAESFKVVEEGDNEVIPDSFQSHDLEATYVDRNDNETKFMESNTEHVNVPYGDPFGLDDLILKSSKKDAKAAQEKSVSEPKFPLGFTPLNSTHSEKEVVKVTREDSTSPASKHVPNEQPSHQELKESINNLVDNGTTHLEHMNKSFGGSIQDHVDFMARPNKPINGFSILKCFQEFINIRQAMGYGMKGAFWGNMLFDFATSSARENKLKSLKQRLKAWSNEKKSIKDHDRKALQESLLELDLRLDKGESLPDDLLKRVNVLRDLKVIDQKFSVDLAQKTKVQWAIEGDENSKFFHGIVNKKKRHLAIKGVLVDGEWIGNPSHVNTEFFNHFANIFSAPDWARIPFKGQFPRCLDTDKFSGLERDVTIVEIKRAVWDCGCDKSPSPDGFTFEFFKIFWSIFWQITDGPLIFNEIISWCKSRKEQSLMFKVDFQKEFHSVRWDHLDDILGKLGFGNKWRGWIRDCLHSSKASILVNGSPSKEFLFHRGLKQGDPLYPFLFILVMKSLHVSFQRLIDRGLFVPIFVGKDYKIPISHLFYADDAMFIGKWSCSNVNALMMMLHCPISSNSRGLGWIGILKANTKLKSKGVELMDFYKLVVGNGNSSKFWHDKWHGDFSFKDKFHRLFNLKIHKDASVAIKLQSPDLVSSFRRPPRSGIEESQFFELSQLLSSVVLSSTCNHWSWSLNGLGEFSVMSARELIDKHVLVTSSSPMRWSKPSKASIGSLFFLHVVAYLDVQERDLILVEETSNRSYGIYESLLFLMPKNQDSLAEDLELMQGSGFF